MAQDELHLSQSFFIGQMPALSQIGGLKFHSIDYINTSVLLEKMCFRLGN